MSRLTEMSSLMAQKRSELYKLQMQADTGKLDPVEGGQIYNLTAEQVQEVKERNEELIELNEKYLALEAAEIFQNNTEAFKELQEPRRYNRVGGPRGAGMTNGDAWKSMDDQPQASLAEMVLKSSAYLKRSGYKFAIDLPDVNMKTLLQTSSGYSAPNPRTGILVLSAQRTPVIADLIPQDPTTLSSIKYMEETTFTNAASTVSEAGVKPEAALAYTERTAIVEKTGVWIPVTEEQLDDVDQMRNIIDNRLTLMVLTREESQLLYGNGTGAVDGFLHNASRSTQAFSTNNADTVFMGMTKVRYTAFSEPSGTVMHPNNWQTIRLAKAATTGEYLMGAPSTTQGSGAPQMAAVEMLWGKPVIITPAITANQGLVGAFSSQAHISRKMGIRVDISDSHDTFFIYNKLAIRAEQRFSLETYRPTAFCELTSLT